jgi:hypothetical protein
MIPLIIASKYRVVHEVTQAGSILGVVNTFYYIMMFVFIGFSIIFAAIDWK